MATDNYVCTLNPASIKKAREELNEIPEDRLGAVQAFREWIVAQPHIRCPNTDALFLLPFLRTGKFSQIRAREKFEHYLNLGTTIPKVYSDLDPTETAVTEILRSGYLFPLPKPDHDGRIILFSMLDNISTVTSKYGIQTLYRTGFILMEYLNRSESNQVNGVVIISDFHCLNRGMVMKLMTPDVSKIEKAMMQSMPGRYKAMHYYRAGVVIDILMTIMKPFTPKKYIDRIKLHNTMESLYEYVPKECLPIEYLPDDYTGPNVGTVEDCINKCIDQLQDKQFCEYIKYRSSSAFGIDESKRPTGQTEAQHFRKLNVD